MFKGLAVAAGLGAMLLPGLGCGGPTDGEVERAERAVRNRVAAASTAIQACEARADRAYRSFQDAERAAARVDPARAAAVLEQAEQALAAAEQTLAEAEQARDAVEESGRGSMLAFEGGRQFTVETQNNPEEVDAANRRVEAARAEAEIARAEASRVRAEPTRAPLDDDASTRADAAYQGWFALQDLEGRYGSDLHGLMSSLEYQVSNRDVMRVITEIDGVLDDLEDDLSDIGCRM